MPSPIQKLPANSQSATFTRTAPACRITPETIKKSIQEIEFSTRIADARTRPVMQVSEEKATYADELNREELVKILEREMVEAAESMDFERAALLRDQLFELRARAGAAG